MMPLMIYKGDYDRGYSYLFQNDDLIQVQNHPYVRTICIPNAAPTDFYANIPPTSPILRLPGM